MKVATTNNNGEIQIDEVSDLSEDMATIGCIPENVDGESSKTVETSSIRTIKDNITLPPINRAQRRALMKKAGKQLNTIEETVKKLNYINLIEKLREINKERKENYETTIKNS